MSEDASVSRDKRSGRGSGRGVQRIVQSLVPGAAHAANSLRRRRPFAATYQTVGAALNQQAARPKPKRPVVGGPGAPVDIARAGLTGGAIGAAAGGAIEAVTSGPYGGVTLPGSDYIGPGNKVLPGAARFTADQIAKEHDVTYAEIIRRAQQGKYENEDQFYAAVHQADLDAENAFLEDWQKHGSIYGLVGAYGLKFKYLVGDKLISYPAYKPHGKIRI